MIFHALAVAALGTTMCMAQGMGQSGMGQQPGQGPQGQSSTGMGQQGGLGSNMPDTMSHDTGMDGSNMMKSPDQMFVVKAAQGGMAEVAMGNIAKQNGGSDAVKQFGDKMVTDHSKSNDELKQLAQQKGINLPSGPSAKEKRTSKMMRSKQGADFDKAYIQDMVKDHETDVAEFRKEAQSGKDPEVKAWAHKTLPTLEQHLADAKQVAGQVGADTNKKSAGAMSSQQQ